MQIRKISMKMVNTTIKTNMEFKCDRIRIKSIIINKYIMYF